ncbi:gamma-aminobutyric acid type B receptor subunit 2-like [Ptychodera flava]|uniref:gamma-aminobutyric acid type B receptor subunit 2-like n=1 Tax=Ptychodera flava TaxID=63121 RepID=UPI003969E0E7
MAMASMFLSMVLMSLVASTWAQTETVQTTATVSLFTTDGVDLSAQTSPATDLLQWPNYTTPEIIDTTSTIPITPETEETTVGSPNNATLNVIGFFPLTSSVVNIRGALPACQMAVEHVNAKADMLKGYFLNIDFADTMCNPGYGTKVLFEFINHSKDYVMVLGPACSGVAQPVAMAANLWNLLQISYGASNPALSNRKRYPSFYRTYAPDSVYNLARLDIVKYYGWTKVATLHENKELFSLTINDLSSRLRDHGINILTSESFTVDPSEQVKNLKEKNARIILGNFYEDMARRVFCEVYKQKMYGKHYAWILLGWYSYHWWTKEDDNIDCTPEQLFQAIDGYIATENIDLSIYGNRTTTSGYTPYEYQSLYKERLRSLDISETAADAMGAYCYDAVWSIAATLNKSMEVLQNHPNMTNRSLEDFTYGDTVMRDIFTDILDELEFDGVSGPVSFTETGDREGLINIEQLQDGEEVVVGIYFPQMETMETKLRWDMGSQPVKWKGGQPPKDATTIVEEYQRIPVLYIIIFASLAGVGVLLALALLIFTLRYWRRSCISKAAPGYLVVLILGIMIVYITVGILGLDAGMVGQDFLTKMCTIRAWTLTIGFTLSYGSIFAKVYHAHKLFTAKANLWKPGSHTLPIMGRLLGFLVIDLAILLIWMFRYPMQLTIERLAPIVDEDNNVEVVPLIEYCDKGKSANFITALMVLHGLQLLLGAFLSYETREVKIRSLNDIFWNGIATYMIVTLSIICAPLSFIINNKPAVSFLIVASLVWTACTLALLIVFVPKILYLRGSYNIRRNSMSRTDEQVYEEEVDEETKLRHKIDEVEKEIAKVKKEIEQRKKFGRYATMRGCGLWFFGHHLSCTCGGRSEKYESDYGEIDDNLGGHTNRALEVSEYNISARSQEAISSSSAKVGAAETKDVTLTEPGQKPRPTGRNSSAEGNGSAPEGSRPPSTLNVIEETDSTSDLTTSTIHI